MNESKKVIVEQVFPALVDFRAFIFKNYTKYLRPLPGLGSLPNGLSLYNALLEFHTSVKGTKASDLHNLGLKEVQRLKCELMSLVVNDLAQANATFSTFAEGIKNKQDYNSSQAMLDYFECIITAIEPRLANLFREPVLTQDTYNLQVFAVPPGGRGGIAFYMSPSVDGRRTGAFFVNANNLTNVRRFEVHTLTLHEGNPGHHLQLNYLTQRSPLPNFLKYPGPSTFGNPLTYNGHIEGWGLYAEYLGNEMNMFADPMRKIGYLSMNLLRAGRLVVDTGIHAFDWSRQKAIDYLADNTLMSMPAIEAEIDR